MTKFMMIYNSPTGARDRMSQATPEAMKASMDAWIAWQAEASKTATFEWGLPLQPVAHLSAAGVSDSTNTASGYGIAEAESKAILVDLLKSHPHLQEPDTSIDVLEMMTMPGM